MRLLTASIVASCDLNLATCDMAQANKIAYKNGTMASHMTKFVYLFSSGLYER